MAPQTKISGNGKPSAETGSLDGVSRLARDVLELGELQTRLLLLDMQDSSKQARTAAAFAVGGVVLLLCTAQTALLLVAAAVVEWGGLSWVGGFAVAVLAGVLVAGGLLLGAWLRWRRGIFTWHRSTRELANNVDWLKSALGTTTPPPRRTAPGP